MKNLQKYYQPKIITKKDWDSTSLVTNYIVVDIKEKLYNIKDTAKIYLEIYFPYLILTFIFNI